MATVFISARFGENTGRIGSIANALKAALPGRSVFCAVNSGLPVRGLSPQNQTELHDCPLVLVIIDPDSVKHERRLGPGEDDETRWQVRAAIKQGSRVVPVYLGDAAPPAGQRPSVHIRIGAAFSGDVSQLVREVKRLLDEESLVTQATEPLAKIGSGALEH